VIGQTRRRHTGLARNFVGALAKAQYDSRIRALLAEGFQRSRPRVAVLFGLGDDRAGLDAAGLVLALFDGLLFQALLDPGLAVEGDRWSGRPCCFAGCCPIIPARLAICAG
jgi:hypothetical protein